MQANGRRLGIGLLAGLLIGLLALPALTAAARGRHEGAHGLRGLERGLERLELTDEVRERVDAILDEARPQHEALHEQLRDAHRRLRDLLDEPAPDEQAVLAQAEVLGGLQTEAHKQKLQVMLQIRPLLSDEQREQLREHKQRRHGRPGERSLR